MSRSYFSKTFGSFSPFVGLPHKLIGMAYLPYKEKKTPKNQRKINSNWTMISSDEFHVKIQESPIKEQPLVIRIRDCSKERDLLVAFLSSLFGPLRFLLLTHYKKIDLELWFPLQSERIPLLLGILQSLSSCRIAP